jgi:thiamine pyrophosphate-dependent acetolactate synthase large subunit-like protein
LPQPQSDPRKLDEAVRETVERLNHAKRPLILVGIKSYRFKAAREIVALVERTNVPCCASVLAKGAFLILLFWFGQFGKILELQFAFFVSDQNLNLFFYFI